MQPFFTTKRNTNRIVASAHLLDTDKIAYELLLCRYNLSNGYVAVAPIVWCDRYNGNDNNTQHRRRKCRMPKYVTATNARIDSLRRLNFIEENHESA